MGKLEKQVENRAPNPTGKGGFKPGVSGNPKGRPKSGHAITDIIRKLGDEKEQREKMLTNVYKLAVAGEKWAVEFIANYDQGKPKQTIETIERDPAEIIEIG